MVHKYLQAGFLLPEEADDPGFMQGLIHPARHPHHILDHTFTTIYIIYACIIDYLRPPHGPTRPSHKTSIFATMKLTM
jgi:hypothetical protein